jgi:hypothetical protein
LTEFTVVTTISASERVRNISDTSSMYLQKRMGGLGSLLTISLSHYPDGRTLQLWSVKGMVYQTGKLQTGHKSVTERS